MDRSDPPVTTSSRCLARAPLLRVGSIVATLLLAASVLAAQDRVPLYAGDSIRVDGEIVGRILSIEGRVVRVVSRQAPRCRAGEMHGEAAICDPAPIVRHTVNLDEVSVERRMQKPHLGLRTVIGGMVGAAAFGYAGYLIGPRIGLGRIEGCVAGSTVVGRCRTGEPEYTAAELAARQRHSDQNRGMFVFGVLGGTATAILARALSVGWVRIEPTVGAGPADPWVLGIRVPAPH